MMRALLLLTCWGFPSAVRASEDTVLYERFEGTTRGAIHGRVRMVPDVVGYGGLTKDNRFSARFEGADDDSLRYGPEVKTGGSDFTVEAFIKPDEGWDFAAIAAEGDEKGEQRVWALVLTTGNGLRFDVMPDGKFHPENSLATRRRLLGGRAWYHVAAVNQGPWSRLYVNGRLCAEKKRPLAGVHQSSQTAITIGNVDHFAGKPRPFTGLIDEVRITRRALAPREFLRTREKMPEIKDSPVPEKYELPFTAVTRAEAEEWQEKARKRLFELVAARKPRRSLDERPLDFKIESSEDRGVYVYHRASFQNNDGSRCRCIWTVPQGKGPFPGMLCLHGHGRSDDVVYTSAQYDRFAERLARGGYCTLAPSLPHSTYAAENLWDLIRAVDVLCEQKAVDPRRLGVMGLSMGGEWTMWIAACDTRLKAAVISGWMCTTEGVFAEFNCPCWELPGFVELMDVCEVNLLIAPRAVLFESAEADPCFPIRYCRQGFDRIRAGYRVFGAGDRCAYDTFPGGHAVHGQSAYPFLDRVLGGKSATVTIQAKNAQKHE